MTRDQFVTDKIASLVLEKRAFINGRFIASASGETFSKEVTSDGRIIEEISSCDKSDLDAAVKAAQMSLERGTWRDRRPEERKKILLKLAELMESNQEELALLDTLETGRAFKNYYVDSIPKAIDVVRWFAEAADKSLDFATSPSKESFAQIVRVPLGIVGCITPWNDPLVPAMWKMAPGLAMGNSLIMKPAEQSSLSLLRVAHLASEAGVPDGVLNILPGIGERIGKQIALHPEISGVFFTGSSDVGKLILQYAGQSNMKKVGLECGGKSPFIVSRNCKDLVNAADTLAKNIFYNQGQICSAPSRAIIDLPIYDEFLSLFKSSATKFAPSNPFDTRSNVGCLISREQKTRIENLVTQACNQGAEAYVVNNPEPPPTGIAISPTILTKVPSNSSALQEEIFGPVACVIPVNGIEEGVRLANQSRFGLAGSIWTDDLNEAYFASRNIEAGSVFVNCYGDDDMTVPFGGFKESGIGKDKSLFAFAEYTEQKVIWAKYSPPR